MGMDAPAALAGSLLGLDISPHFDNPFAAKSFAELWNKRWNLTVGNALRFLIYDPINECEPGLTIISHCGLKARVWRPPCQALER